MSETDPLLLGRTIFHKLAHEFLGDFLTLVDPDLASHLLPDQAAFPDLSRLNQEVVHDLGVVANVPDRQGSSTTVLIHAEGAPSGPAEATRLLVNRFVTLETRLVQPVYVSVVYLRGGRPGPNVESAAVNTIQSLEVLRLFYTAFGLATARADYYLERPEPLAWALAAAMRPVRFSPGQVVDLALERIQADPSLSPERRALLAEFVAAATAFRTCPAT